MKLAAEGRICVLMTENLPVPAVLGGASEGLTEKFLLEREKRSTGPEFSIISTYSFKAATLSQSYKYSRFYFIRKLPLQGLLQKVFNKIYFTLWKELPAPIFLYLALKRLRKLNPSVIIVENRPEYLKVLKRALPQVKLILHHHNDTLNSEEPEAKNVSSLLSGVLCVSQFIASRVSTISIINPNKIKIIYNGVDLDHFRFHSRRPELPKDPVMAYLGRVSESKGVGTLLEAFLVLQKSIPGLKLKILGSSWYGNNIREPFLKQLENKARPQRDKIIFTGFIHTDLLPEALKDVHVLVVPSQWEEPAGLTVVEGQALGVPVVAAHRGGIPELITPETGTLYNSRSEPLENLVKALEEVFKNYPQAVEKASLARKRMEKCFGMGTYYENFISLTEELIAEDTPSE